ncbi:MAG: hypothetical protein ACREJV_13565 [Candidatus Rokuibacteriota bacterium]
MRGLKVLNQTRVTKKRMRTRGARDWPSHVAAAGSENSSRQRGQ